MTSQQKRQFRKVIKLRRQRQEFEKKRNIFHNNFSRTTQLKVINGMLTHFHESKKNKDIMVPA